MQHSPSSACQQIPNISKNPKVHYCDQNSLPIVPNLSQINLVKARPHTEKPSKYDLQT
jgi:hypothetical protein